MIVATNELRVSVFMAHTLLMTSVSDVTSDFFFFKYSSRKPLVFIRKPIHFRIIDLFYSGSNSVILFVGSNKMS